VVILVALVTQCVYAWRIWILSRSVWVPIVVAVVRGLLCLLGLFLTISLYLLTASAFPRWGRKLGRRTLIPEWKVFHAT
jgi:hypothetical protein